MKFKDGDLITPVKADKDFFSYAIVTVHEKGLVPPPHDKYYYMLDVKVPNNLVMEKLLKFQGNKYNFSHDIKGVDHNCRLLTDAEKVLYVK